MKTKRAWFSLKGPLYVIFHIPQIKSLLIWAALLNTKSPIKVTEKGVQTHTLHSQVPLLSLFSPF